MFTKFKGLLLSEYREITVFGIEFINGKNHPMQTLPIDFNALCKPASK